MAKKNILHEVKALGGKNKIKMKSGNQVENKNLTPVLKNNRWEAWEGFGSTEISENWHQVWEGSLDDCFERLGEEIECQIQDAMNKDGNIDKLIVKYDHEPEVLVEILQRLQAPQIAKFKEQCLQNGECVGRGWFIAASPSKFKKEQEQHGIFAYSDEWEAWELTGSRRQSSSGRFLSDGSLSECLESVMFFVTMEVDMESEGEINDEMNIDSFFANKTRLRSQKVEEVKKACLKNGEYKGKGWVIRSQRTREQCEWIANNGKV